MNEGFLVFILKKKQTVFNRVFTAASAHCYKAELVDGVGRRKPFDVGDLILAGYYGDLGDKRAVLKRGHSSCQNGNPYQWDKTFIGSLHTGRVSRGNDYYGESAYFFLYLFIFKRKLKLLHFFCPLYYYRS